jgi:ABC-type enterobactin transport system permease subunit
MKKSYVFKQDFKAPYVVATGLPHRPTKIMLKKYKQGQIIQGQMVMAKGKPSVLLVSGVIPIPLTVIREVVTKEILQSNASGNPTTTTNLSSAVVVGKKSNTRYIDAAILGAILGLGAAYLAEKQNLLGQPDKKNKLYGAAIGAVLAMYIIYRKK